MQRHTKIFLVFSIITLFLILMKFYIDLKEMKNLQNIVVKDEAKSLSALFIDFRKTYQDRFLKNHIEINEKTINLLPVRTTTEISERFSNIVGQRVTIRTVSDRPRNLDNKANDLEMNIIDYFERNPQNENYFKANDNGVFYYAQPLYITKSCLKCHGKKESAIQTVKEQYDTAYGYKICDLRGIISIKILKKEIIDNINKSFYRDIITAVIVYLFFLTSIYLVIRIIIKNEKEYSKNLENKVLSQVNELRKKDSSLLQQSKMAEMGEMIGNIAHQWRQPLSIISTSASGLKMQNEFGIINDDLLNESMDNIVKNTKYLSKTIDDFREFIKNDRDIENFNLYENISSTLEILRGTLTHYEINIILNMDKTLYIKNFSNDLTQSIINIINNAKDAFNEKNIEKRIIFTQLSHIKPSCFLV